MKKILSGIIFALFSLSAMAEHHENADLHAAIQAFDKAYASNDVETYFGFYAEGATVYFFGARQDVAAYKKEWTELIAAGGGVEMNEMSDLKVQVMPSGDVAIATSFVETRSRAVDGSKEASKAFETDVWQEIDGKWQVISLHYSVIPSAE